MTEVINLRTAKAARSKDSKDWTAEDALEDALADLRAKRLNMHQMALHYMHEKSDGTMVHGVYCVNMTRPDHIALLNIALKEALESWMVK